MKHKLDINLSLGHIGDALMHANSLPVYHCLPLVTGKLKVSRMVVGAGNTVLEDFLLSHSADPNINPRGELHTALECAAFAASVLISKLLP